MNTKHNELAVLVAQHQEKSLKQWAIISGIVGTVMIVSMTIVSSIQIKRYVQHKREVGGLEQAVSSLKKQWGEQQKQLRKLKSLKKQHDFLICKDVGAMLQRVSEAMPKEAFLTSIEYYKQAFKLKGFAADAHELASLCSALSRAGDDVRTASSTGLAGLTFDITIDL